MSYNKLFVSPWFILLQSFLVVYGLSWKNCGDQSNVIQLRNFTIEPYPISASVLTSATITAYLTEDVQNTVKAQLTVAREILGGLTSVKIPCTSGIGSCTYNDVCTIWKQCDFPIKAGEHTWKIPIQMDLISSQLGGTYDVKVQLTSTSDQKGCIEIDSLEIQ